MEPLRLNLPTDLVAPEEFGLNLKPDSVHKWLQALPLSCVEQAGGEVLGLLRELNRSELTATARYQHLIVVLPVADKLVDALRNHYSNALLPLSDKNLAKHRLATELSNELGIGFRLIIRTLVPEPAAYSLQDRNLLVTSLYLAIQQLTKVLVEYYLVYFPEPAEIWGEINRLYLMAEQYQLQELAVPHKNQHRIQLVIDDVYKCALLTAIASPYHLMQAEVLELKNILFGMIERVRLQDHTDSAGNCFVIDTGGDNHPRFVADLSEFHAVQPRYIDIQPLIDRLKALYARQMNPELYTEEYQQQAPTLAQRLRRDMIRRVIDTLNRHSERQHKRQSILGKLNITIGLSASHYHSSNESPFNPEIDEVTIHTGKTIVQHDSLSLVPMDFEHWRDAEAISRITQGIETVRTSSFEDDNNALDIWKKIYGTQNGDGCRPGMKERYHDMKKLHATSQWTQKNTSDGGMCIFCQPEQTLPVRVGELIAYNKTARDPWQVGVVRWLRVHENEILEMGVMHLLDEAVSVACRSIRGTGEGSEYFRSLLADADVHNPDNSLIVPTAVFDTGTEVVLNTGDSIHYLRLQKHLLTTRSVTQFSFELIDCPSGETHRVNKLRAMV